MTDPNLDLPSQTATAPSSSPIPTSIEITQEIARGILATIDHGLTHGLGNPVPGQMCVEAAICSGLNIPHADDPPCVCEVLRVFTIRLNDCA